MIIIKRKRGNKDNFLAKIIAFLIPVVLLFDWLLNFEIINIKIALYLRAISVILFLTYILSHKIIGFGFKQILLYFLALHFIYSLFSIEIIQNLYLTTRVSYWIFGTMVIYNLYENNSLKIKLIEKIIFYSVIIGAFFTLLLMSRSEEHQNASAYLLLWCLPMLLLFKQTYKIKIAEVIVVIAIMVTIKRGAMLALIISIISYLLGFLITSKNIIKKSKIIFGVTALLSIAALVVIINWNSLSTRLEDTGGSGRDIMYQALVNHYINGDLVQIIFGFGINSVEKYTNLFFNGYTPGAGVAAHSDWLQYTHDFGVFGIIFMVLLNIKLIIYVRFHFKSKTRLFPVLLMTYSILFLTTVYSFILNTPTAIYIGIILAVASAETNKLKRKRI